jgi:hypothetical protein
MAMGRNPEEARDTRRMTANVILRTPQGTRKFLALIDCAAEENFISQRLVVEQGLTATPTKVAGRTINSHKVIIYGEHALPTFTIDSNNIRKESQQAYYACDMQAYDLILGWS